MKTFLLLFCLLFTLPLMGMEFNAGSLSLEIHAQTGRFTLYHVSEDSDVGQPLFYDRDPRTSYLSVIVDGRVYRLGDSSVFNTYLDAESGNPVLVFESNFIIVRKEFIFIQSPAQRDIWGLGINISLENVGTGIISAGARYLLDINLSDSRSYTQVNTNFRNITGETLITRADPDLFWADIGNGINFAGSINTGSARDPDRVHFAAWQRFYESPWEFPYRADRNFTVLPYSIRDSAVTYYFDPAVISPGGRREIGFILAMDAFQIPYMARANVERTAFFEDQGQDMQTDFMADLASLRDDSRERDLEEIRSIIARIDHYIASGLASESEINELENTLNIIRQRYNIR